MLLSIINRSGLRSILSIGVGSMPMARWGGRCLLSSMRLLRWQQTEPLSDICGCGRQLHHRGWCWARGNITRPNVSFTPESGTIPKLSPAVIAALRPLRAELVKLWLTSPLDLERIAKVHMLIYEMTGFKDNHHAL